jgi:hypothetical protein
MKYLLLISLLAPVSCFSQLHAELGGGISVSQYQAINDAGKPEQSTAILPTLKIGIGFEFSGIVLEASAQPTLVWLVNTPKILGLKAGYNINGFIPFVGYYSDQCNSDNTGYNSSFFGYGLKYQWQITDNGGLYFEGLKAGKNIQITGGIHYKF